MKASIIAVFFNNEETAAPCLDSLLALRWPAKELIVVFDTAARDGTGRVLQGYRDRVDRYIELHGVSTPDMYNAGIEAATGELALIVDGDILHDPAYLERLVPVLERDPKVACALGRKRVWNRDHSFYVRLIDMDYDVRMRKGYKPWVGWLYRRKVLDEMGGYVRRAAPGDLTDYEMGVRLRARGYTIGFSEEALWFEIERKNLREEFWRHFRRGRATARSEVAPEARRAFAYVVARSFYAFGLLAGLIVAVWIPPPWRWPWLAAFLAPLVYDAGRYFAWSLRARRPLAVLHCLLGIFYRNPAFALGWLVGALAGAEDIVRGAPAAKAPDPERP